MHYALSIRQPWAHIIVYYAKDIENRVWNTSYRGPLLIHAARSRALLDADAQYVSERQGIALDVDALQFGGIIGVANLVNVVRRSDSMWFEGPFGLVLRDAQPLPFVPLRGQLGIFPVDAHVINL